MGSCEDSMARILISDRATRAAASVAIHDRMYQYSRAIYRSIREFVDPYVDWRTQLAYRREVLAACEGTMERLATRPGYPRWLAKGLFRDVRPYFPLAVQAQVAWTVSCGVEAAAEFVTQQEEWPAA